jgi:hypothetical protein
MTTMMVMMKERWKGGTRLCKSRRLGRDAGAAGSVPGVVVARCPALQSLRSRGQTAWRVGICAGAWASSTGLLRAPPFRQKTLFSVCSHLSAALVVCASPLSHCRWWCAVGFVPVSARRPIAREGFCDGGAAAAAAAAVVVCTFCSQEAVRRGGFEGHDRWCLGWRRIEQRPDWAAAAAARQRVRVGGFGQRARSVGAEDGGRRERARAGACCPFGV